MFLLNYGEKFIKMREVGKHTTECLDLLTDFIKPGITSNDVNRFVKEFGEKNLLENADYGYEGFPAYCCTSLNEVMCHGLPNDDVIEAGVLKVDVTFRKNRYHGDACRTYLIGDVPQQAKNFVQIAQSAMIVGIQQCSPGNKIGDIGRAIEEYVIHNDGNDVYVARDFTGHGIGTVFHDNPNISHVLDKDSLFYSMKMEPGMTFTIEPIINMGSARYRTMSDGWGVRQKERKLSAQFEATLGITETGREIFCQ